MGDFMLNIYTVSFFGHRIVDNYLHIEKQVENLVSQLLAEKEFVEFLVGKNGEFDNLVSSVINRLKRSFRDDNCCHTLVLPYATAQFEKNRDSFDLYYDQVDIFETFPKPHYKAAITIRNREMVNRSNLAVFYIEHNYGGAYQTYKYAEKQNKKIFKLIY